MSRGRLEIFSDAVFAVAITLLALNLRIAGPGHGLFAHQLMHEWQAFVAYLISFFTIGAIWVNHHSLLDNVAFVNRPLMFSNLVLLLFVVLIPVTTRLLADYLQLGGSSAHLAAAVYGMGLEGMAVGFYLILEWTLRGEGRTEPPVSPDRRWAARVWVLLGIGGNLLIVGGAFISPLLAFGLSGVIIGFYAFEQTPGLRGGSSAPPGRTRRPGMNRGRLEIFSDAVFAVAITLLALNLMVAGLGHGPLAGQLTGQWQAFVAYLISFFTIGAVWVNHHSLLSGVAFVNRSLMFSNLVLLLFVVLIPVTTRLLADYLQLGGSSAHLAAAVYGVGLEGMAVGFYLILEWTLREGRTQPPMPPDRRWAARARFTPGLLAYLAVIGCAFISPLLALAVSGAIDFYYVFEQTPLRARGRLSALPDETDNK